LGLNVIAVLYEGSTVHTVLYRYVAVRVTPSITVVGDRDSRRIIDTHLIHENFRFLWWAGFVFYIKVSSEHDQWDSDTKKNSTVPVQYVLYVVNRC